MPNRLVRKESHDRLIYYEWRAQDKCARRVRKFFFANASDESRCGNGLVRAMSIVHPPRLGSKNAALPPKMPTRFKIITGRHYFSNDAPAYHSIEVDMTPTRLQATEKE
jgi:hypothetical protein